MILQKRKFRSEAVTFYFVILGAGAAFFAVQFFNAVFALLAKAVGSINAGIDSDTILVMTIAACCGCFFAVLGSIILISKISGIRKQQISACETHTDSRS
jgi:hypothetical protein